MPDRAVAEKLARRTRKQSAIGISADGPGIRAVLIFIERFEKNNRHFRPRRSGQNGFMHIVIIIDRIKREPACARPMARCVGVSAGMNRLDGIRQNRRNAFGKA